MKIEFNLNFDEVRNASIEIQINKYEQNEYNIRLLFSFVCE